MRNVLVTTVATLVMSVSYAHEGMDCESHAYEDYNTQNYTMISEESENSGIKLLNRIIASAEELFGMAGSQACPDLTRQELRDLDAAARRFGGTIRDPRDYDFSVKGLQAYITDSGVISKFSAMEMVTANNQRVARLNQDGKTKIVEGVAVLLPPKCRWPSGVVQALVAGKLREVINGGNPSGAKKITLRNWWRPARYNKSVKGASRSDHRDARGFDLDFPTGAKDRAKAQNYLCKMYKEKPFNLQVGIGCITLHVGVGSPKRSSIHHPTNGSRWWTYKSVRNGCLKRLDTDNCWVRNPNTGQKRIHTNKSGFRGGI